MLQLIGSPVAVFGPPFRHAPLPIGAVTLVVVETALVTPAVAAVADSSTIRPEKASTAARRPEIRALNPRALKKRSMFTPQCVRSRTVYDPPCPSYRSPTDSPRLPKGSPTPSRR